MAKTVPLSRRPRRLTSITARIATVHSSIRNDSSGPGKAEMIAAMPAATLTETVRT